MIKVWKMIYRLSAIQGIILSLPALFLIIWYSWNSYTYLAYFDKTPFNNLETFHIVLHDFIEHDFKRLTNNSPEYKNEIKTYNLELKPENLSLIYNKAAMDQYPYVNASMELNGDKQKIQLRILDKNDFQERKKSLRIKVRNKNNFIDNFHQISLLNPDSPMLIDQKLYFDIASKSGLLVPELNFVRLKINHLDMGVYQSVQVIDELFIRKNKRVLGNLYSYDPKILSKKDAVWTDLKNWDSDLILHKDSSDELRQLLKKIGSDNPADFIEYSDNYIDLDKFALLESLDIIFANDKYQSFKLYFDPYKLKWEPVLSSFDGFKYDEAYNLNTNPLYTRLQENKRYKSKKYTIISELIKRESLSEDIYSNAIELLNRLKNDLENDYNWRARKLLPKVNSVLRQIMRPMDTETLFSVVNSEINTLNARINYIRDTLFQLEPDNSDNIVEKEEFIGPGKITFHQSKIFSSDITIVPGTSIEMGKNSSLIFLGKCTINGQKNKPVIIKGIKQEKWGGIIIQVKNLKITDK